MLTKITIALILQSDKKWHPIASGTRTISANRAYLKPTTSSARISGTMFVGKGGTTNIVTIDHNGTVSYYDLQGQRIDKPTKAGIYVKDGKKTVVR